MISTYREDLKGSFGLQELFVAQSTDRLEYRGRPQLWFTGPAYSMDGTPRSSPVQLFSSGSWTSGELGVYNTNQALFMIDHRGKCSAFGDNSNTWLGLSGIVGNELNGTWAKVKPGGHRFAFGLLSDSATYPFRPNGVLKGWGQNNVGQLGLGDTVQRSSPTQVPGNWRDFYPYPNTGNQARGLSAITVSPNMFALTTNDQLWAWGQDLSGMHGQNDAVPRSSPVQIPGVWKEFERMSDFCGGIRDDGIMYMWGNNGSGQLGLNDTAPRSSPNAVTGYGGSSQRWRTLINSNDMATTYAIKQDGSMWAWGSNSVGQLGLGDTVPRSSPIPVPGSWELVIPKNNSVLAMQAGTGIIYGWGENGYYQLGHTKGNMSKPTPIPGIWDSRYGFWFNGWTAYAVKRNRNEGDFQGLYSWGRGDFGQTSQNVSGQQAWPKRTSFFPQAFWAQRLNQAPSNFGEGSWVNTAYILLRK